MNHEPTFQSSPGDLKDAESVAPCLLVSRIMRRRSAVRTISTVVLGVICSSKDTGNLRDTDTDQVTGVGFDAVIACRRTRYDF
jgi:hypothetical protein